MYTVPGMEVLLEKDSRSIHTGSVLEGDCLLLLHGPKYYLLGFQLLVTVPRNV
jgi:hypothetical protein